jgi:U3 small nucleolar RNA-associated protein 20
MAKGKSVSLRKAPKGKGGTESSRNHHFEGFSQRIAKINIDPVRRVRRNGLEDDLSATDSYFKTSLDEWRELNLSDNFTTFAQNVQPLCDTLPQLLHHEDEIMDLMVEYIEKRDANSLEPILSLLAHFAHDLGARFEKHFARAVTLVTQVASKHSDIEAIEWSFTCLAWLFKYLSRLLVPDLRPVYDLLSPLLGKERQKPFVVRFAAEALSFLIRKAGSTYHRKPEQLEIIIKHIVVDLNSRDSSQPNFELFLAGTMTLLVESIQGVQRSIHSSGLPIFHQLSIEVFNSMDSNMRPQDLIPAERAMCGVLVAIMHHTEPTTFGPLLDQILEDLTPERLRSTNRACSMASRLLFLIAGVRRGARVEKWGSLVSKATALVRLVESKKIQSGVEMDVLAMLAVILQSCPLDRAIPELRLLERLTDGRWEAHFLSFCTFFAELGSERFQSLLLPQLKR